MTNISYEAIGWVSVCMEREEEATATLFYSEGEAFRFTNRMNELVKKAGQEEHVEYIVVPKWERTEKRVLS